MQPRRTTPHGLTLLVPIRAGEEEGLRRILGTLGDDIRGRRLDQPGPHVHVDFPSSRYIHFARLAVMPDPDRGQGRERLLFVATFDGGVDCLARDLTRSAADLDTILGACEGYLGTSQLAEFLRRHAVEHAAFYVAFRDQTAHSLKAAAARRRQLDRRPEPAGRGHFLVRIRGLLRRWWRRLRAAGRQLLRALPALTDALVLVSRHGFRRVLRAARGIAASLDRLWYARLLNILTFNKLPPLDHPYSQVELDLCRPCRPLVEGDEVGSGEAAEQREDRVRQNQLTLLTVIDPGQLRDLRAVLGVMQLYLRRLAPAGSLAGISTIHFARWAIIDGGRRLLFASDYDGSWEAYIDEFAELILSGLDAIWGSSLGRPDAGARDLPAFKRFLRCHQIDSQVFYSAYPEDTVLNILDHLEITARAAERGEK